MTTSCSKIFTPWQTSYYYFYFQTQMVHRWKKRMCTHTASHLCERACCRVGRGQARLQTVTTSGIQSQTRPTNSIKYCTKQKYRQHAVGALVVVVWQARLAQWQPTDGECMLALREGYVFKKLIIFQPLKGRSFPQNISVFILISAHTHSSLTKEVIWYLKVWPIKGMCSNVQSKKLMKEKGVSDFQEAQTESFVRGTLSHAGYCGDRHSGCLIHQQLFSGEKSGAADYPQVKLGFVC